MYHIYSEDDLNTSKPICDEETKDGDDMCTKLKQLKGKEAKDLLSESKQLNNIPVDLDKILEHYGVKKIPTDFSELEDMEVNRGKGEISGLVLSFRDDLGIFYKQSDSIHRKRFTIAHELAHCCLHSESLEEGYIEWRNPDYSDEKELEANIFAGKLLIPRRQLDYVLQRLIKPSLYGLAEVFQVSANVMRARLEYLRIPYYDDKIDKMIAVE